MVNTTPSIHSLVSSALPAIPEPVIDWVIGTVQDPEAPAHFSAVNAEVAAHSDMDIKESARRLFDFVSPVLLDQATLAAAIIDPSHNDDESPAPAAAKAPRVKPPTAAAIRDLCAKLVPLLGQSDATGASAGSDADDDVDESTGARRLAGGPIHMSAVMDGGSGSFMVGGSADITHAGTRRVATRVDAAKLEKAELKLKAKMEKRNTDIEVSFKAIDKKQQGAAAASQLSDAQIREILAARGKSNDIHLSNFDISNTGLRILTNSNLSLVYGRRYGLVGRNGIGKSTLLRAIAAREIPGFEKYKHVSIGYVEQELTWDHMTVLESVVAADVYRAYLLRQEQELSAQLQSLEHADDAATGPNSAKQIEARLKQVYAKMEEIDAHASEARAGIILSGLGFSAEAQTQQVKSFSGGWRMRVALARALFTRPDLLLLDEPTNHLDIPAVVWLSNYLSKWPSTLLVVSHDREFLDTVVTDIMHQHDERLDVYKGNFSVFEKTSDERRKQAQREYEAQMQHRAHLQAFVDRWRYNAKRATQAQSRMKILEKLPELEVPTEEISVTFQFPAPEKISPPILQMNEVDFGYSPDKLIVRDVNLDVQLTSRVAVVGPNGAGKSTVLKLLTGGLDPLKGHVFRHGRLKFAFFSQHHVDALEDLNLTPVQFLSKNFPGHPEEEYRRQLGCFGISGRVGLQPMGTLSGGQKSRVVFASLALQRPAILVLDEPTNHLDYMSVDSLADALRNFGGGVLIVSHDQRFIDMCCNEIWVCDQGKLVKFGGESIADYRATLDIPE